MFSLLAACLMQRAPERLLSLKWSSAQLLGFSYGLIFPNKLCARNHQKLCHSFKPQKTEGKLPLPKKIVFILPSIPTQENKPMWKPQQLVDRNCFSLWHIMSNSKHAMWNKKTCYMKHKTCYIKTYHISEPLGNLSEPNVSWMEPWLRNLSEPNVSWMEPSLRNLSEPNVSWMEPWLRNRFHSFGTSWKPGARFRAAAPNHPEALLEEPQAFQAVGEKILKENTKLKENTD